MEKKERLTKLKDFIKDELEGDIKKLKDYNLWKLRGNKKFGKCSVNCFDCDDTYLIRLIYSLVWNIDFASIGQGKDYRGDTMNTFATLLSKDLEETLLHIYTDKTLNYEENAKINFRIGEIMIQEKEIIDYIISFSQIFLTIGNMIVLPNKNLHTRGKTLNTYRGPFTTGFNDYFDTFLFELKKCFTAPNKESYLHCLYQKNEHYFNKYSQNTIGFKEFCEANYLTGYLKENDVLLRFKKYTWWDNAKFDKEREYKESIVNYIKHATEIINLRADKIIYRLEEILKES